MKRFVSRLGVRNKKTAVKNPRCKVLNVVYSQAKSYLKSFTNVVFELFNVALVHKLGMNFELSIFQDLFDEFYVAYLLDFVKNGLYCQLSMRP